MFTPSFSFPVLFLLLLPSVNSISFQKTRFDPGDPSIFYEGGATPYVGTIEFTSQSYMCQVGRATYAHNIPLWDSKTGTLSDFFTHFSFFIDVQDRAIYAAGVAFFLVPVDFEIPPNSSGGFLGLYNFTTSRNASLNRVVHVEFDSFADSEWDPPVQHVGINKNSLSSLTYTGWNASYHSGDVADVWINYNSTTKNLSVTWSYQTTSNSQENNSLSYVVDLREVLPEWVKIGFSAATRDVLERHALLSWEFSSNLDGIEANNKNGNNKKLIVILPVSAAVLVALLVITYEIFRRKKKKLAGTKNLASINDDLEKGAGPRRFSYQELISATHNFSHNRKLGEGGFGEVYRGYLSDSDMLIAVKKIFRKTRQGKREYISEAKIISQLRHRNLVQLIGWCHDRGEFLLVYEFMPNGSLDAHLFGKAAPLTWDVRYRIAIGLASGLLYLHEEWEQCVVHRDVKSSNVMLDSSFNAKLGDFGLAKLMDHELGPQTTGLAGTLGYLAPEYISTGRASKESDVYSFGVVALEIASGRKALDPIKEKSEMSLVEWIWGLYASGKLSAAVDRKVDMNFDEEQARCLMIVGLWCAHPDRSLRPSIRQAIHVLNFEMEMPNLPTKMPVPVYHVHSPSSSSSAAVITESSIEVGR